MVKLPGALVELLALGTRTPIGGVVAGDDHRVGRVGHVLDGDPGGVAESADLARAVDRDRAGHERRTAGRWCPGSWAESVIKLPVVGFWTIKRRQVDRELAAAIGRGKQDIRVRRGRGVGGGKGCESRWPSRSPRA